LTAKKKKRSSGRRATGEQHAREGLESRSAVERPPGAGPGEGEGFDAGRAVEQLELPANARGDEAGESFGAGLLEVGVQPAMLAERAAVLAPVAEPQGRSRRSDPRRMRARAASQGGAEVTGPGEPASGEEQGVEAMKLPGVPLSPSPPLSASASPSFRGDPDRSPLSVATEPSAGTAQGENAASRSDEAAIGERPGPGGERDEAPAPEEKTRRERRRGRRGRSRKSREAPEGRRGKEPRLPSGGWGPEDEDGGIEEVGGAGSLEELEEGETALAAPPAPRALRRILVNGTDAEEIRIAVLEKGRLEELYYERPTEKKYLGNIYKGRVVNLEPAIQAAFVDIGIGRNGFLHVSDVLPAYKDAGPIPIDSLSQRLADRRRLKLQELLRKGQEVLVQISKDSIGAKGPSLTTYISVPGKYLVLMPGVSRYGVSKRIQGDAERADLRAKLAGFSPPPGLGYIIRTAGQDKPEDVIGKDLQHLMGVWEQIRKASRDLPAPSLIFAESDLVIRTLRDLFGADVEEILVDTQEIHERAHRFLLDVMPQAARRLNYYTGNSPLFSRFGVEEQIERIYNRRVPLPSGGHIVIEQTEALVAIDVNSGKYRDEEDLEATALKTNLEAADEIARQLRLRDLGGVIINDFIDMENPNNRRDVEKALRTALKKDRAKSWITRISRFGIVEMTRQRVRPSFERETHEPCKLCHGAGIIKSPRSTGTSILRQLRAALAGKRREVCEVVAYPDVVEYLVNDRRRNLLELETEFNKTIVVKADPGFSPDQFFIRYP
jgi:ribonuclease E